MAIKIKKIVGIPLGIAGFSVGAGLLGESLGSPALKSAGQTAAGYVPIAVNISMAGALISQLRDLKPRRKK
jgi:hypothetical protein